MLELELAGSTERGWGLRHFVDFGEGDAGAVAGAGDDDGVDAGFERHEECGILGSGGEGLGADLGGERGEFGGV